MQCPTSIHQHAISEANLHRPAGPIIYTYNRILDFPFSNKNAGDFKRSFLSESVCRENVLHFSDKSGFEPQSLDLFSPPPYHNRHKFDTN